MNQFNPGNLIYYVPYHPGDGTNLILYGTEFTEVKWVKRNTIGIFIKLYPDPDLIKGNSAICLFGEQLFTCPITSIKPYTEEIDYETIS